MLLATSWFVITTIPVLLSVLLPKVPRSIVIAARMLKSVDISDFSRLIYTYLYFDGYHQYFFIYSISINNVFFFLFLILSIFLMQRMGSLLRLFITSLSSICGRDSEILRQRQPLVSADRSDLPPHERWLQLRIFRQKCYK